jgi:hypothetical protein
MELKCQWFHSHGNVWNWFLVSSHQMSIGVRETEWVQLAQLGLGKALDATNPHPWASKSSYQAKEVKKTFTDNTHLSIIDSKGMW